MQSQDAHRGANSRNLVTAQEIEAKYPFKNLPSDWMGLYAPDNGVINVQLLLRTLLSLAKDYGAEAKQHTQVDGIVPSASDSNIWEVHTTRHGNPDESVTFKAKKIVIASGAYVNHVLQPSFNISLISISGRWLLAISTSTLDHKEQSFPVSSSFILFSIAMAAIRGTDNL